MFLFFIDFIVLNGYLGGIHTVFRLGNLKERDNSEDLRVDERLIFEWIFFEW
jgi:hypothetical protein